MRERRAEAAASWRGLVSEQVESGKSVAAFCIADVFLEEAVSGKGRSEIG